MMHLVGDNTMPCLEIARLVGLHHNGEWLVDQARFEKAIALARQYNTPILPGDKHGTS